MPDNRGCIFSRAAKPMKSRFELLIAFPIAYVVLIGLHFPLLRLPYFWDEAGYYIPAAFDLFSHWLLIPQLTLPTGHTPLVMVYLSCAWHLFGFSPLVTRAAMVLIATATVVATYTLGRKLAGREAGLWAAALLALSPLFFAQSSLVFLDLTAALFTTLAIVFTLDRRWGWVALTMSLAVLSKETAVIALPVIWGFLVFRVREHRARLWALSVTPLIPLLLWALYYHNRTGFWTGNAEYLRYNLYSASRPLHMAVSFLTRIAEILVQGFNWVIVAGASAGIWWTRTRRSTAEQCEETSHSAIKAGRGDFLFVTAGLTGIYIVILSIVGGAILPRYMLPVLPAIYVWGVALIGNLPKHIARLICLTAVACFITSWFINPPYPYSPYEDNLAYANFVRLHERAAEYLESLPDDPVILTSWPATDELRRPFLGYVGHPLRVASVDDFTPGALARPPRFDVLYLYSRKWEQTDNWPQVARLFRKVGRLYGYEPAEQPEVVASRLHLILVKQFQERGQWVKIYAAAPKSGASSQ